ncbi:MAG TPA: carboxypeptidase-like regulatory domain-containing protein [Acidobacteriaceae bacterium]|nr:carboxypeptidase-like regulatory domain-containing protein [Acidobacteriaceae bacterium]
MRFSLSRCALLLVVGWFGLCRVAGTQTKAVRSEPEPPSSFGAVTGHVYLAGSNAPARFVSIALQPVKIEMPKDPPPGKQPPLSVTIFHTGLNGEYLIPRVAPGTYYLVTMQRGFFSPFALFTKEDLEHPSAEVRQRMESVLPTVVVRANNTANLDVTLQRGASFSGTVRFDDGTPYSDATVFVDQHAAGDKWVPLRVVENDATTDAEGHWSISGLPPGEYRIGVQMQVMEMHRSSLLSDSSSFMYNSGYNLPVWFGDTTRERDAKSVTLAENQAAQGQDLTIPVSKIHQVTGAVVDQATGQALNAGHVQVVYADDGKEVASVGIDPESRTYTVPFLAEGEYKLRVKDAREVRFEQQGDAADDPLHQHRKEIVVRQYGPGELPLIVQGETSGVNVPVEAKAAKAQ